MPARMAFPFMAGLDRRGFEGGCWRLAECQGAQKGQERRQALGHVWLDARRTAEFAGHFPLIGAIRLEAAALHSLLRRALIFRSNVEKRSDPLGLEDHAAAVLVGLDQIVDA